MNTERHRAFLLATAYCIAVSAYGGLLFDSLPPRFMDLYLIGIAGFAVRYSSSVALWIWMLSIPMTAFLMPPRGSLAISEGFETYRLVSYSLTGLFFLAAIEAAKKRP